MKSLIAILLLILIFVAIPIYGIWLAGSEHTILKIVTTLIVVYMWKGEFTND